MIVYEEVTAMAKYGTYFAVTIDDPYFEACKCTERSYNVISFKFQNNKFQIPKQMIRVQDHSGSPTVGVPSLKNTSQMVLELSSTDWPYEL